MKIKYCPTCNITKPITDFHKSKERSDKHQGRCKSCMNKITREYINSEAGKVTQNRYRKSKKGKKSHINSSKLYRQKFPERAKARKQIEIERRNGNIISPNSLKCKYCPKIAKHYHHYLGYDPQHWLDVEPVCNNCHSKIHAGYII